jgi:hypothetical protein
VPIFIAMTAWFWPTRADWRKYEEKQRLSRTQPRPRLEEKTA